MKAQLKAAGINTNSKQFKAVAKLMTEAAKEADPNWEIGKPIKYGALNGITRESIENPPQKSGSVSEVDIRI